MIPQYISNIIEQSLNSPVDTVRSVHGGDINQAAKLTIADGRVFFVKWNAQSPDSMFETESKGLQLLASAGTALQVPKVFIQDEGFLVLEWIDEGTAKQNTAYNFGVELAKLHKNSTKYFGLDHNNFIGKLHQSNSAHSNWADFFAIERIEPQIKMGVESGTLTRSLLNDVQKLYAKLGAIFPNEPPALLHGDLWSGNYMFTKSGGTSIYDPAAYYGHREMDLAMTQLFGGFPSDFYEGYNDQYPMQPGFDDRVTICNLYPILVHANLFGGSYSRQAENIIQRYA